MLRGSLRSRAVVGGLFALSVLGSVLARPGEAADLAKGEKIYKMMCLKCHGETGKGDGPKAKELSKKPANYSDPGFFAKRPDEDLKKVVIEGKEPMPSFQARLSSWARARRSSAWTTSSRGTSRTSPPLRRDRGAAR